MILPSRCVTIVGVLNLTPDSFSDGGRFVDSLEALEVGAAIEAGLALVGAGADILDLGGESTRPGSRAVPAAREVERVLPVIEGLAKATATPISIDTRKAEVAEASLEAGASIVNDVSGLRHDPRIAEVVCAASPRPCSRRCTSTTFLARSQRSSATPWRGRARPVCRQSGWPSIRGWASASAWTTT
jgi:dihydropteroate synthase